MIISRTPFRVSLFGGGTDYPAYYLDHGGSVISFSANKYCYVTLRNLPRFFDYSYRLRYHETEEIEKIELIKHPVIRCAFARYAEVCSDGIELVHQGDLPSRTGLGSSSAFSVGLLAALRRLSGASIDAFEVALEAIDFEQNVLRENVGSQDQLGCALGGLNRLEFLKSGEIMRQCLPYSNDFRLGLEESCFLVFSGVSRTADVVAKEKIKALSVKQNHMENIKEITNHGLDILLNNPQNWPAKELGQLLSSQWEIKKSLASSVSIPEVEQIYRLVMHMGAFGGKLLGAGGGGFILFIGPPGLRAQVEARIGKNLVVDLSIDPDGVRVFDGLGEGI